MDRDSERRYAPRYATKPIPAVIGWRAGGRPVTARAALVDMSMGGAQLRSLTAVPSRAGVLIRLPLRGAERPLRATVVSVVRVRRFSLFVREPQYAIRLSFDHGCSFEVFKAAVDGFVEEIGLTLDDEVFLASDWR